MGKYTANVNICEQCPDCFFLTSSEAWQYAKIMLYMYLEFSNSYRRIKEKVGTHSFVIQFFMYFFFKIMIAARKVGKGGGGSPIPFSDATCLIYDITIIPQFPAPYFCFPFFLDISKTINIFVPKLCSSTRFSVLKCPLYASVSIYITQNKKSTRVLHYKWYDNHRGLSRTFFSSLYVNTPFL